jgi:hypothetical protein
MISLMWLALSTTAAAARTRAPSDGLVVVDVLGDGVPRVKFEAGQVEVEHADVKIDFRDRRVVLPGDVVSSSCPAESGILDVRHKPVPGLRRPSLFVVWSTEGMGEGRWECTARSTDGVQTPFVVVVRHAAD